MNKHRSLLYLAILATTSGAFAQSKTTSSVAKLPEANIARTSVEAHIRFLASDELRGRRTGEPGNMVAARYIAEQFRLLGLKPAPNQTDFYQNVPLQVVKPASSGSLTLGGTPLEFRKQFLVIAGPPVDLNTETAYIGYGLTDGADGYNGRDVKGKIVVAQVGSSDGGTGSGMLTASQQKRRLAAEKGAVALIELYTSGTMPWAYVTQMLNSEQLSLAAGGTQTSSLPTIWVDNAKNQLGSLKEAGQKVSLQTSGRPLTPVNSVNVAGIIEGTDPKLKNEYVMLSAHFDHVGVAKPGSPGYSESDSIFNGTRDNAMGVAGLLAAAKAFSEQPPKRSIIIVALTGEEVGLLGSRYYAEHPLVPLNQTIFNLNIDNAGYNDTSIVSVIGLDRTGAKADIEAGAKAFGLSVVGDPAPEQGLFDRSDNVNFAIKGVPAPTFSAGFRTFNEELMKYYHRVADNPDSIDFNYLLKFCQAYTHAARLIADRPTRPKWAAGDKYEPAAKVLYGL
ncbi:M20/M25/M40 family metallo-hydrolase [Nibrella saemangeumensis]|uniref:M20/M25/M40 family metallo-hydrolase n=1 Tax=Nibrella saemangeumensis TaxID=1084526 RepID=A0ABP8MDY4_9BACT